MHIIVNTKTDIDVVLFASFKDFITNVKTNKFASSPNCSTETKDLFTFESNQKSNHFDFLPNSPKLLFLADTNKYKEEELD